MAQNFSIANFSYAKKNLCYRISLGLSDKQHQHSHSNIAIINRRSLRLANAQRNSFTFCRCFFFASLHFIKTKLNQLYIKLRREIYNKIIFIAHYHRITVRFAKLTKKPFFMHTLAASACFARNVQVMWNKIEHKSTAKLVLRLKRQQKRKYSVVLMPIAVLVRGSQIL